MKKVYEPGEMFQTAFRNQAPGLWYPWDVHTPDYKKVWAEREKIFFALLAQQCKQDEQADDSSGLPAVVME